MPCELTWQCLSGVIVSREKTSYSEPNWSCLVQTWGEGSTKLFPTIVPQATPLAPDEPLKLIKCGCCSENPCSSKTCSCKSNVHVLGWKGEDGCNNTSIAASWIELLLLVPTVLCSRYSLKLKLLRSLKCVFNNDDIYHASLSCDLTLYFIWNITNGLRHKFIIQTMQIATKPWHSSSNN